MKKITDRKKLILYGCSGMGVNMLTLIVGSYLCSALLVGGFDEHIESWTYLNRDLVVAGLWAVLVFFAKALDGFIDLPLASFADRLNTKFGRRKTALALGFVPMVIAYLLFLCPIDKEATILNTVWFGVLLWLYGHNLADGTKFHNLTELRKEEKYYNSPINIITEDGIFTFTIFSFYKTDRNSPYTKVEFESSQRFALFCMMEQENSMYESNFEFKGKELVITLSTCVNDMGGRWCTHAVLTNITR